jgi:uncharacterized protein (DUF1501 family)
VAGASIPAAAGRLVIVRLRGGADGLSMVPPWGEPGYYRLRPTIAVPPPGAGPAAALDLDGFFGLHPRLAPLLPLYRDGTLGIVHACGHPDAVGSHLVADEFLDSLVGASAGAVGSAGTATPDPTARGYPSSPFGRALARIAIDVREGTGPRVLVADSCGWDHHAGQREPGGPLERSLDELARGLTALARDLDGRLADTTVVTVSEFGRAVAENGHGGTEHGHATAMLVLGGRRRGGRVEGHWTGLDRHALDDHGGLAVTTSLADVLRTLA